MAYLTHAELASAIGVDRLSPIADYDSDGSYDEPVVTAALEKASAIVDSYISAYLPLASPYPQEIVDVTAVIATWNLRGDRDVITEDAQKRYDAAMKWLRDIAKGVATIPGITEPDGDEIGSPEIESGDRIWTRDIGRRLF